MKLNPCRTLLFLAAATCPVWSGAQAKDVTLFIGLPDLAKSEEVNALLRSGRHSLGEKTEVIIAGKKSRVFKADSSVLVVDDRVLGLEVLEARLQILKALAESGPSTLLSTQSHPSSVVEAVRDAYRKALPGLPKDGQAPLLVRPELSVIFEVNGQFKRLDYAPTPSREVLASAARDSKEPRQEQQLGPNGEVLGSPLMPATGDANRTEVVFDPRKRMSVSEKSQVISEAWKLIALQTLEKENELAQLETAVFSKAMGCSSDLLSASNGTLKFSDLPKEIKADFQAQFEANYSQYGFTSITEAHQFFENASIARTYPWWNVSVVEKSGQKGHSLTSMRLDLGPSH